MRHLHRFRVGVLAAGISTALSATSNAQPSAEPASREFDASRAPETVIVTGTRVAGRTIESSLAPIDVLSSLDIEKANKVDLLETLNTTLPSFNLPNVATPNIGSMVRAGQLRGLSAGHTLVLVNGKRRHSTAFLGAGGFSAAAPVDLSLIPSSTIERIEVLRDGAAAIYGSDAIAGVVNIITKKADSGGGVSTRSGQFFDGDGFTTVVKADAGFAVGSDGHLHVSGQIDDQEIVIRNGPVPESFLFYFPLDENGVEIAPAGNLSSDPRLPAGATPNPKEATRNNNAWINQGHAPFRLGAVTLDFGKPLSRDLEVYSLATWAKREGEAPQNFRHPSRDEVVRAIYPDGFTPVEAIDERDYSLLGGIRRDSVDGWNWDLSTSFGRDDLDIWVHNSINPTFGLDSQTSFFIGNTNYRAWTTNFDVNREIDIGALSEPLVLSLGVERRREHYQRGHGDFQSYSWGGQPVLDGPRAGTALGRSLGGAQALPGYRPEDVQDARRDATSIYAGIALIPTEKWSIDLAARHEDYSDFGTTSTGRISTRYDFTQRFGVRGTVSNGFQAPALAALAYKNTGNANTSVNHTLQVTSPEALALGAKPLRPEESRNVTLGFVADLASSLTFALDLYEIEVDGRIAQSTTFREGLYPGSGALVVAAGFGAQDGISYFINAADTRSRGVEATLEGRHELASGSLRWSLAANYSDTDVTGIAPTPDVLAAFNIPVFSQGAQLNLRYQAPLSKEIFSLNWSRGPWTINLRETHYGAIKRFGNPTTVATSGPYAGLAEIQYSIGDLWVTDVDADLRLNDKLRLTFAVNNLFDVKPDKLPEPLLAAHQLYSYTNNGPVSAAGGFYSVSLHYQW